MAGSISAQTISVPLKIDAGVPLRLYLTQRLNMHVGETAHAKLIEPIYAYDRIVIPAGAEIEGRVTQLDPVPKLVRIRALMGGDFTPLHFARVEYTTVRLPDGREVSLLTEPSTGLATRYEPPKPPKKQKPPKQTSNNAPSKTPPKDGLLDVARREAQKELNNQINAQISARTQGLGTLVRGPNKKERLVDLAMSKMPYHPQWYRRGTRFDAVIEQPLDFGTAALTPDSLRALGSSASFDQLATVRFLSTVSSGDAQVGDRVEAVLTQPLVGDGNRLVLPEGTRLAGAVRQVRHARWFHRSGRLRFTFDQVALPEAVASLPEAPVQHSEARLETAETNPAANVKIDSEGSAKATEPKTRLIAPAIAALIALKSMDNDSGKRTSAGANGAGNAGGSALGGFSGFGLLGVAAARASSVAGSALGVYGMAASVYMSVVSRGHEVEFQKNSAMEVRFGARPLRDTAK